MQWLTIKLSCYWKKSFIVPPFFLSSSSTQMLRPGVWKHMSRVRGSRPGFYETEKHKPGSMGQKMPESDSSSFLCPFKCEPSASMDSGPDNNTTRVFTIGLDIWLAELRPKTWSSRDWCFMYVTVVLVLPMQGSRWWCSARLYLHEWVHSIGPACNNTTTVAQTSQIREDVSFATF